MDQRWQTPKSFAYFSLSLNKMSEKYLGAMNFSCQKIRKDAHTEEWQGGWWENFKMQTCEGQRFNFLKKNERKLTREKEVAQKYRTYRMPFWIMNFPIEKENCTDIIWDGWLMLNSAFLRSTRTTSFLEWEQLFFLLNRNEGKSISWEKNLT